MKLSPNQINRELQEIASAHLQINSYHWGDLSDIQAKQVIHYPLMNCYLQSGGAFNNNTTDITIIIEIYDILYKDSDNLNDVESDTKQISRDIYQVVNKSTRWKRFGKVNNSTNQKYKWLAHDDIAGWSQSVNFKLRDVSGVCDLPMQNYDFDQDVPTGSCPDVRIINSDLSFDETTPAGSTYNLTDITSEVLNTEGEELSYTTNPAQNNLSVTLPDITVTDSDGTSSSYPTGLDYVCTPSALRGASAMPIDDGLGENLDARPFFTLPIIDTVQQLNHFGSKWAFTGTTGGYYDRDAADYKDVSGIVTTRALAYPDDLICDWRSFDNGGNFLMYNNNDTYLIATRPAAITTLATATIGSFTGFRLATLRGGERMQYRSLLRSFGYPEFYDTTAFFNLHTSTEYAANSGYTLGNNYGDQSVANQFLSLRCIVVRNTNISEL